MIYGSETKPLLADVWLKFEKADMPMAKDMQMGVWGFNERQKD